MAVTVSEAWDSPLVGGDRMTTRWFVRGAADAVGAYEAAVAQVPSTYAGYRRQSLRVTERLGEQEWLVAVEYAPAAGLPDPELVQEQVPSPELGAVVDFETGGRTQHIVRSLKTLGKYAPAGKTAPDFKGLLNVTRDGVQGLDVVYPTGRWNETHRLPAHVVDRAYFQKLMQMTGAMNDAPFRGFEAGEVLLLGVRGRRESLGYWELTFSFEYQPNAQNLQVGDITVVSKLGHAYLWTWATDSEDADAHELVKAPAAAYVEQIYPSADFGQLKIGT